MPVKSMGRLKMRDMNLRHQFARVKNAGHENTAPYCRGGKCETLKMRDQFAGVENTGKVSMESQSVKKCLKVIVFVCRVIPSV